MDPDQTAPTVAALFGSALFDQEASERYRQAQFLRQLVCFYLTSVSVTPCDVDVISCLTVYKD